MAYRGQYAITRMIVKTGSIELVGCEGVLFKIIQNGIRIGWLVSWNK